MASWFSQGLGREASFASWISSPQEAAQSTGPGWAQGPGYQTLRLHHCRSAVASALLRLHHTAVVALRAQQGPGWAQEARAQEARAQGPGYLHQMWWWLRALDRGVILDIWVPGVTVVRQLGWRRLCGLVWDNSNVRLARWVPGAHFTT